MQISADFAPFRAAFIVELTSLMKKFLDEKITFPSHFFILAHAWVACRLSAKHGNENSATKNRCQYINIKTNQKTKYVIHNSFKIRDYNKPSWRAIADFECKVTASNCQILSVKRKKMHSRIIMSVFRCGYPLKSFNICPFLSANRAVMSVSVR